MDPQDKTPTATTTVSTSEWLRREADPIWQATFHHPIVAGIGSGDTPLDNFIYFMRQDYIYLIEFSRLFAYAATKSPTLDLLTRFAGMMQGTLNTEMALHRSFCGKFGLTSEELEATEPSPTTLSYTSFLLNVAQSGTLADILSSLLPCFWGYMEIGIGLAAANTPQKQPLYEEWIENYTNPEYHEFCDWLRATFDQMTMESSSADRERYRRLFINGSRYEYLFWEAARTMARWPV